MTATAFYGSKHFENEVKLLREKISRYLELGYCITHNERGKSALASGGIYRELCKEIAKQRGNAFIHLYWHTKDNAVLAIPNLSKLKPLFSQATLIGKKYERGMYGKYPVQIDETKSMLKVFYNSEGTEALRAWMNQCENESQFRFLLGLPPKVSASR